MLFGMAGTTLKLHVACRQCGHKAWLPWSAIPEHALAPALKPRLRCSSCSALGAVDITVHGGEQVADPMRGTRTPEK